MFKHDQRRRSDDAMRAFTEDRTRLGSEISKIKCPTLVVRGALSDVLTDEAAEKFARSLPDGRCMRIKNSGHNVQGDNPRSFLDAMLSFFLEAGI
jgi:pimeloyl-ACP methyl ester carboxylesterase